jgi:anti-sigma B factor antagonist
MGETRVDLAVSTNEVNGARVVVVGGEVDVYTAPLLRDALDQQIAAGHVHLVVDLDAVEFMDSTGLGVLVGRLKLVRNRSGWLRVVCSNDRVLKVFGITGLDRVFTIADSIDAAVNPPEPVEE